MNILFDHQIFAIQRFGGISRIFIELMRELSKKKEPSICWHRGLHTDGFDVSDYSVRLKGYWSFEKAPFIFRRRTNREINELSLKWFVKLFGRQCDIYHPTYYDYSLTDIVTAKKLVITIHDLIPEKYLISFSRFHRLIEDRERLIRKADLIFVNSWSTLNDLLDMFRVDAGKVFITHWATNIKEIAPMPASDSVVKRPYFLYVGTRSKYKNFEILMKAFASDEWLKSNFRVVCFGGSGDFTEPELKFFEQHNMTDKFIYITGSDGLLKTLYLNAQALVYTSRYEGFGLPPLEAMECKCPVVCCPTSSIPEVVGDAAIFFNPDSAEELTESMHAVAKNSVKRSEMIQKGQDRQKLFSWEKTAEETLEGYKFIV